MATPVPGWKVWAAIGLIAAFAFAIRYSFIYLLGRIEEIPPRLERALDFVPASVLAALSVPAFILPAVAGPGVSADPHLLAGVVGGAVAWQTEDLSATIVAGMATLWALQYLGGSLSVAF